MHDLVKDYYGQHLKSSADLRTSACCDPTQMPDWMKPLLARIHPEESWPRKFGQEDK